MARIRRAPVSLAFALGCAALVVACGNQTAAPALNKVDSDKIPDVPVPAADGPKLGALANVTPIYDRPSTKGTQIGYLHAGAKVARAAVPYTLEACPGGWYPVRPRGFVCATETATTDLTHPTLVAMALDPKLDQPLPYTYARARLETPLYERDPQKESAVKEVGKLPAKSGMAVIGSWSALDPEGQMQRLAMLTNGRFVRAADLDAAEPSDFVGVQLDDKTALPVAFIVKRGVRLWTITDAQAEKQKELDFHKVVRLTGKYREIDSLRYWATDDGKYLRHRDVTVVRKRNAYPEFASGGAKWIDISVVTGTLVLYEGTRPVFVTLVSTGRDRLGDPKTTASTALGTFTLAGKHITAVGSDAKIVGDPFQAFDAPWAIELSSGQMLHGAYWHSRFGIENGPGNVQLSPGDALHVWQWVEPAVPEGWHGITQPVTDGVRVVIHK